MKLRLFITAAFMGGFTWAHSQVNIFPNGTFEAAIQAGDFQPYGWGSEGPWPNVWTFSRVTSPKVGGTYSMKVDITPDNSGYFAFKSKNLNVQQGKGYILRLRIFIPTTGGIVTPCLRINVSTAASQFGSHCEGTPSGSVTCSLSTSSRGTWIDFSRTYSSLATGSFFTISNSADNAPMIYPGTFYLDNVELIETTPLNDNESVNQSLGNITLSPSGGIVGIPYTYLWNDGFTGKDRTGLLPGTYTVAISQGDYVLCNNDFSYTIVVPQPTIQNLDPDLCLGEGSQLTATCSLAGTTISWWDAPTGGNQIGTGNVLPIPPYSSPGNYLYYAQADYGTLKSTRRVTINYVHSLPGGVSPDKLSFYIGKPLVFTAVSPASGDQYFYDFGNGNTLATANSPFSYTYPDFGDYSVTITTVSAYNCETINSFNIGVHDFIPLCQTPIPASSSGTFKLDQHSGQVVFDIGINCVPPIPSGCIEGKINASLDNVVTASASTYSGNWTQSTSTPVASDFENGRAGKWRVQETFGFNTTLDYQTNSANLRAGRFTLSNFSWKNPNANLQTGWLLLNKVEQYSANGEPTQERNALKTPSAARFGYDGLVPTLIVQNAEYGNVFYEGFEKNYGVGAQGVLEDGLTVNESNLVSTAHSGAKGFLLSSPFVSRTITSSGKEVQVRYWISGDVTGLTSMTNSGAALQATKISQSGSWSLWESKFTPATASFTVTWSKSGGSSCWIDDVRIQPVDAEMTCYVYEPGTLKLLTVFDDQHFGMYHQYNEEGKLVRKLVETGKGIKTIQETQYNTPRVDKTQP